MELKQGALDGLKASYVLLIAPNGIETLLPSLGNLFGPFF